MTRVKRRVPLADQELLILPEYLNSSPVFSGVRVARSLVFCVVFLGLLFVFLSFYLSVILLFMVSGIFKLFCRQSNILPDIFVSKNTFESKTKTTKLKCRSGYPMNMYINAVIFPRASVLTNCCNGITVEKKDTYPIGPI